MSVIRNLLLMAITVIGAVMATAAPAQAYTADPKTFVSGDNIFYAYVESGETVAINFAKSPEREQSGIAGKPITVTVNAPGAEPQICVIPPNVPLGQGCNLNLKAVKDGIWQINFRLPADSHVHNEVSSNVRWNGNLFNWSITVSDSGGERKGRLWSELYAIRQPAPQQFVTDLSLHYISEDGYLYRVVYRGYNGQISTLSADAFGIVRKSEECVTAYQSINVGNPSMEPSFGKCGGSYKLFFEQPSDDLPTEAKKWDGTADWVRPNVDRPMVEGLKFTPDKATDRQSGVISYDLKNFVGQYEIRIDTNGDGKYDGPGDRTIKKQIKNLKSAGPQSVKFNGLDRRDDIIAREQPITVKINIVKTGEIHLVGADIEGRAGGIELVRLSGDNVPSFGVCWNDTELGATSDGLGSDLVLDGSTCPDSRGGVHKWNYSESGAGSWGNGRYIDDWVFTAARVRGTAEIKYPQAQAATQEEVIQNNMGLIIAVGAGVVIVVGVVGVVLRIRHNRKKARESLLPPGQMPPSPPSPPAPPLR